MRDAASILAVDGVLIGAADLSMEMGVAASDPRVTGLIDEVLAVAAAAGKPCGFALGADPGRARELAARGFGFLVLSNDTSLLASAAASLVAGVRS